QPQGEERRKGKVEICMLWGKKKKLVAFITHHALCYPTNDSEDLGKLQPKADIGIFVGYAPGKKAFRIYNRRTRLIIETIHVTYDELIARASEQFSLGPGPQLMTPATHSSGLVSNHPSPTPSIPPTKTGWEILFQPIFDEYFSPPTSVASPDPVVVAPVPIDSTGTPSSTSVDQDAPSPSTSQTPQEKQPLVLSSGVEEENHEIEVVIPNNVHSVNQPPEHISKWTKDHPIDNVIGDPSRPVSTRHQIQNEALFCYIDAFFSSVEPKSYKEALTESCWIKAMQEELNEFECFFKSEIENVGTKSRAARPSARRHTVCRAAGSPAGRLGGRLGSLNNQISSTRDASALDPDTGFFVLEINFAYSFLLLLFSCTWLQLH
ncbi:putative ribonuclease H-like domain-containing protein, partial [Tanacetum coccineum]